MSDKSLYPFVAIVGQEDVKKAILLNLIEPEIGGVLLSGEKGTAKSTIVRSITPLIGKEVVTVPLNVTEDRIIGSINMEHAMKKGKFRFEPGLLMQAHKNVLYIDEVNLLSNTLSNTLLDAAASKINIVERESISYTHESDFLLIGSMNPEEGYLKSQLLDRFGFYVEVKGSQVIDERVEIIRRRMMYEENPSTFTELFSDDTKGLRKKIIKAKNLYPEVIVPEEITQLIAKLCAKAFVAGHRGDIVLTLGAKAHAAYMGRNCVTIMDIEAVLPFALPHRMRETPIEITEEKETNEDQTPADNENQEFKEQSSEDIDETTYQDISERDITEHEMMDDNYSPQVIEDEIFEIDESFIVKDIFGEMARKSLKIQGSGRRHKTKSFTKKGRYIKYRLPKDKINDIAFDATVRQAAPFQKSRDKGQMFVKIHHQDIREKVREDRIGNMIMFLVDTSGSMGINKRMSAAKGAIFSLLKDAYQKRDIVGMMTFRGNQTEVVLNTTRSIDLAYKKLQEIKTGGRTPLTLGIQNVVSYIKGQRAKNQNIVPIVIIISDGRGNVKLSEKSFVEELVSISKMASKEKIEFIVVDSETGFLKLGLAKTMADSLDARYLSLDELREGELVEVIKQLG
jgi:magnesium chelatase subunit D